ncbi:MAG: enoyl-CoA hydratase [Halioglobus sp.]
MQGDTDMPHDQTIAEIQSRIEHRVLHIAMNRPEKKNALIAPMYLRMAELIEQAGASSEVRAIYLTGTQACFCAGNDVTTFTSMEATADGKTPPVRFLEALARCELPVVAAVNGPAIGVGTTLLLHCDFVIAGQDSYFQVPFVQLGVCPEAGSSFTIPLRMGYHRAAEFLLLGEKLAAQQALEWGLVNAVHPAADYQSRALALAERLAQQPPTSLRVSKRLLRAPLLREIELAMAAENASFATCLNSPEFGEAIAAFLERRPADFSGF